jgi:hypothetical protein
MAIATSVTWRDGFFNFLAKITSLLIRSRFKWLPCVRPCCDCDVNQWSLYHDPRNHQCTLPGSDYPTIQGCQIFLCGAQGHLLLLAMQPFCSGVKRFQAQQNELALLIFFLSDAPFRNTSENDRVFHSGDRYWFNLELGINYIYRGSLVSSQVDSSFVTVSYFSRTSGNRGFGTSNGRLITWRTYVTEAACGPWAQWIPFHKKKTWKWFLLACLTVNVPSMMAGQCLIFPSIRILDGRSTCDLDLSVPTYNLELGPWCQIHITRRLCTLDENQKGQNRCWR